ncbi:MAG TPA: M67 family metallopeptidase [Acidimicrobiales bacterium]|nr:M67 family metallopeptidase [Acidimicrobiales bacterium]
MIRLDPIAYRQMLAHAYDGYPDEACGLLGGAPGGAVIEAFVPCRNADESAKTYSIGPDGWQAADEAFGPLGIEIVGVMHSHTHTDPYPSPTDVAQADNPLLVGWHYIIVSLRDEVPSLRCWLLDEGRIVEEGVELAAG